MTKFQMRHRADTRQIELFRILYVYVNEFYRLISDKGGSTKKRNFSFTKYYSHGGKSCAAWLPDYIRLLSLSVPRILSSLTRDRGSRLETYYDFVSSAVLLWDKRPVFSRWVVRQTAKIYVISVRKGYFSDRGEKKYINFGTEHTRRKINTSKWRRQTHRILLCPDGMFYDVYGILYGRRRTVSIWRMWKRQVCHPVDEMAEKTA